MLMLKSLFSICFVLLFLTTLQVQNAVAKYPQRIVSLGPINTENVFLLGAGDRLVANTSYCVRPEAAKNKEKIGSVMQLSIEKIIAMQPDLVLATGLTRMPQLKQLESIGITVARFSQPNSFAEICTQFLQLGRLLGLEDKAKQIVKEAKEKVVAVQKSVANLPSEKVFLQVGAGPIFSSIPSSFTNDFIVLAGGTNIASNQKNGATRPEQVIAENPDVIIVAMMGIENGVASKERDRWLQISVIEAAANKRVHTISPDLACSPSPTTFASTLALFAKLIHPELNTQKLP